MKAQMRGADRSRARWAAIVGDDELQAGEVTLRDMGSGDQERIAGDQLLDRVRTKES
jgi:histidyl-tRNA synthetase